MQIIMKHTTAFNLVRRTAKASPSRGCTKVPIET